MAKYMILALTNPVAGKEAEFNQWYDEVGIPTYGAVSGLQPLGRFKLADVPKSYDFSRDSEWDYLSLYSFETDDYEAFMTTAKAELAEIAQRTGYQFWEFIDKTRFFEPVYVALDG